MPAFRAIGPMILGPMMQNGTARRIIIASFHSKISMTVQLPMIPNTARNAPGMPMTGIPSS